MAAAAGGTVGVAAIDLESGGRVALEAVGRFPMTSVYKFPIGLALLRRAGRGTRSASR